MILSLLRRRREGASLFVKWALLALALLVGISHLVWIGKTAGRLFTSKVWVNRGQDAISRSADAAYGQEYMECIQVLRAEIPEDALVVVTRTTGLPQYDSRSFLQYFLFPRELVTCPGAADASCPSPRDSRQVYFLAGVGWDAPSAVLTDHRTLPCSPDLQLLAPASQEITDG